MKNSPSLSSTAASGHRRNGFSGRPTHDSARACQPGPRPRRPARIDRRAALLAEPFLDARLQRRRRELFGFRVGDRDRVAVAAIELEEDVRVDEGADAEVDRTSHERFERIECVARGRGVVGERRKPAVDDDEGSTVASGNRGDVLQVHSVIIAYPGKRW